MRKLLLSFALLAGLSTSAFAQIASTRFGITGGINVTNMRKLNLDNKVGFHAGFKGDILFKNDCYTSVSIMFSQKGYQKQEGKLMLKANPGYIQCRHTFGYRKGLKKGVALFAETGPYLAIGVCGKERLEQIGRYGEDDDYGMAYSDKFFDKDEADANVFDAGWCLRAGVEFDKVQLAVGYEHGFCEVFDESNKVKNWGVNFGLTYFF